MAGGVLTLGLMFMNAAAGTETFSACTKDGQTASVEVDLIGSVTGKPSLSDVASFAWGKTASEMDGAQVASEAGFSVFKKNLYEALDGREISIPLGNENIDRESLQLDPLSGMMQVMGPPAVTGAPGSCKLAP